MTDKGTKNKVKGKAEEIAGNVTHNKKLQREGKVDQAVGELKSVAAEVKEKAEEVIEGAKDKKK